MTGPAVAVRDTRVAVRRSLSTRPPVVLVACSGGADSTALAAALAFEGPRHGLTTGLVTVDHGWSEHSAAQAQAVAGWGRRAFAGPVELLAVDCDRTETDARRARYAALETLAAELDAVVLLGHTLDDQAETVLMRLARGSGARSLAAMSPVRGVFRRPFLGLTRQTTLAACVAQQLPVWDDPSNADRSHARVRVRLDALPTLAAALGDDVRDGLVRSAELLRADADLLDELAAKAAPGCAVESGLDVEATAQLPDALRWRVLRSALLAAGAEAAALTSAHVHAVDALLVDWHGQGPVALPGRLSAARRHGTLVVTDLLAARREEPSDRP